MTLTLTMINFPPGIDVSVKERVFHADGGVLGRGAGNEWVLDDPDRFLSSRHCQIVQEAGSFYLVDLSTNGTFINGSSEPVGRGNKTQLNNGDQIDVGEYKFKVTTTNSASDFNASPFEHTNLANTQTQGNASFGGAGFVPDEGMFMSSNYDGAVSEITPDELKLTDPLAALDRAGSYFDENKKASDDFGLISSGSQEDSADVLKESIAWPETNSESPVLPDDWGQDISILGHHNKFQANDLDPLTNEDALIGGKPDTQKDNFEVDFAPTGLNEPEDIANSKSFDQPPTFSAEPEAKLPKPGQPRPGLKEPKSTPNKNTAELKLSENKADSVIGALGLGEHSFTSEQVQNIEATVGSMMRESLDGLMQILRSRTSIKNEFRMNVTTIKPIENNPLKFSANVDEALETMFVRRSKAYLDPAEAIKESFNSIADHQVAVIAGIRQAFRAVMSEFEPALLEEEFKKAGKTSVVPGMTHAKYWAAYQKRYQSMVDNMERSFQDLFGDEFVQAYEEQLRKLAHARSREN